MNGADDATAGVDLDEQTPAIIVRGDETAGMDVAAVLRNEPKGLDVAAVLRNEPKAQTLRRFCETNPRT